MPIRTSSDMHLQSLGYSGIAFGRAMQYNYMGRYATSVCQSYVPGMLLIQQYRSVSAGILMSFRNTVQLSMI